MAPKILNSILCSLSTAVIVYLFMSARILFSVSRLLVMCHFCGLPNWSKTSTYQQ